jgi:DNA-binding transcriptional MocR family regulator
MAVVKGDITLRGQIHDIMALEGINSSVEDLVITTGSQHGLELLAGLFLDEGDVVIAEGPSYVGALGIFRHYLAEVEHVYTQTTTECHQKRSSKQLRSSKKQTRKSSFCIWFQTSLILLV